MHYVSSLLLPISLQDFSYRHGFTNREENSVDPDQLAFQKPADLDLHCFHKRMYHYLAR